MFRLYRSLATTIIFSIFSLGAITIGSVISLLISLVVFNPRKRQLILRAVVKGSFISILNISRFLGILKINYKKLASKNKFSHHVIIANHPTLIDYLIIISLVSTNTNVMVANKLNNSFMNMLIKKLGYISNDACVENFSKILDEQDNILIFPEGTRTKDPSKLKFLRGAANFALRNNMLVTPFYIKCSEPFLSKGFYIWQSPQKVPIFTIEQGDDLDPLELISEQSPLPVQIREFNQYLENLYINELNKD